jgi:regulator of protease activity HflC (stomatin/prohibitin superfamily)
VQTEVQQFTYENPAIQEAIDSVFQARQDEEVAKAEALAAQERRLALQLQGEGEAARILEAKRGEAEGIMLVADANAYELEVLQENPEAYIALKQLELEVQRLETWDGRYPTYLFQTGNSAAGDSPSMLLNLPTPSLAEQTP